MTELKIFQEIALQPHLIDSMVKKIYRDSFEPKTPKFSTVFTKIFPPSNGSKSSESVLSWLNLTCQSSIFKFLPPNIKYRYIIFNENQNVAAELIKLIRDLGICISEKMHNIIDFVGYLIWVYGEVALSKIQMSIAYYDDEVFGFMEQMKFGDIRAVIVGEEPSSNLSATGFIAFHGIHCDSPRNFLSYINNDLQLVDHYHAAVPTLAKNYEEMENLKKTCNFEGLIRQNVLFVNTRLRRNEKKQANFWLPVIQFLVSEMNQQLANVPFIIAGKAARSACKGLIDETKHLVLHLHHPNSPNRGSNLKRDRAWQVQLPFINVNAYLHAHGKPIIDWSCIKAPVSDNTMSLLRADKWKNFIAVTLDQLPGKTTHHPCFYKYPILRKTDRNKRVINISFLTAWINMQNLYDYLDTLPIGSKHEFEYDQLLLLNIISLHVCQRKLQVDLLHKCFRLGWYQALLDDIQVTGEILLKEVILSENTDLVNYFVNMFLETKLVTEDILKSVKGWVLQVKKGFEKNQIKNSLLYACKVSLILDYYCNFLVPRNLMAPICSPRRVKPIQFD